MTDLYDVKKIRAMFPALNQQIYGKPLVYLDNAATTQKPLSVIEAMNYFYKHDNANVHRGVHALSMRADRAYETVRDKVAEFIHAGSRTEIIFTRGTTESINLVASSLGEIHIHEGDEILITGMEHHANIVPWQMLCERKKAILRVVPVLDDGSLDRAGFKRLLSDKTKLVSVTHVSNALGTINPIKEIIDAAHAVDALVLIDAAQSIHHLPIDVKALDCDFLVFSGHKMYGPTGVGILYGKKALLNAMPPYQGGGDMIFEVNFEKTTYNALPLKFEAGTPNIAGVIGLGAAIDLLNSLGMNTIAEYESQLADYLFSSLNSIEGLTLYSQAPERTGVASFTLESIHAHDIATILDRNGVAVRAGHHCAMPLMKRFNVPATARASLALYNTVEDVDMLVAAIDATMKVFNHE
jgi:cysteine desulfurase/selenocysteine lyase